MARAGVVVDVERKEALLYRNRDDDRHFVRLDLEAYRRLLGAHLTYEPLDTRHGFSTHFADLPRDRKLAAVNQEEAVIVGGIICDHLAIVEDACFMTVDHSRQLKVDRGLLELTEAGMPSEVKWFPVKVVRAGRHQLGLAGQGAPAKIDELMRQAEKGITDALNSASKALSRPLRVAAIAPGKAEASAFTLPANLKEVASYEEFEKKWAEAEAAAAAKSPQSSKGSHHHWHD
ncbi:MAG TPA: hypothetical protein PK280_02080 [Planctomycetota bacterium]|nr:hypothetical protein [Planctomycetota bacterium]